jgi:hypothetical protein
MGWGAGRSRNVGGATGSWLIPGAAHRAEREEWESGEGDVQVSPLQKMGVDKRVAQSLKGILTVKRAIRNPKVSRKWLQH